MQNSLQNGVQSLQGELKEKVRGWKSGIQKMLPDPYLDCKSCGRRAKTSAWKENLYVCPFCGHYRAMSCEERFQAVFDEGSVRELDGGLQGKNLLDFPGYSEKLKETEKKTGLSESAVTKTGTIGGIPAVVAVMDSRFFMGSMSSAVGERITRAVEYADENHLPLIICHHQEYAQLQRHKFLLFIRNARLHAKGVSTLVHIFMNANLRNHLIGNRQLIHITSLL